jgi:phosphate/sulfate permease
MISIWFYLIGMFLSLIIGGVLAFIFYSLFNSISNKYRKRNLPKDKKEFLDGGKEEITERRIEENEQRKFKNTREFERLRRIVTNQRTVERSPRNDNRSNSDSKSPERDKLPSNTGDNIPRDFTKSKRTKLKLE